MQSPIYKVATMNKVNEIFSVFIIDLISINNIKFYEKACSLQKINLFTVKNKMFHVKHFTIRLNSLYYYCHYDIIF